MKKMKLVTNNGKELDAAISIGIDSNLLGLFLEARSGKSGVDAKNPDYNAALELILKRLYESNIKEVRIFRSSNRLPFSDWKIENREIFISNNEKIKLSNDYSELRVAICNAQAKFNNSNAKGGNPSKRIFIHANIQIDGWENLINDKIVAKSDLGTISTFDKDESEQEEIINKLTAQKKTKEAVLQELLSLDSISEVKVAIAGERYKRDNQAIARIKYLRDFSCQVCGTFIEKRNGQRYVEAAHIDPKRLKGKETLDNIILLCPNHHKEFDLGNLEILNRSGKMIEIKLNNKSYKINLDVLSTPSV